jgi:hypothetical protein
LKQVLLKQVLLKQVLLKQVLLNAKTLIVATSHVPMLSQPQKVAEFVIEAAASLGASN